MELASREEAARLESSRRAGRSRSENEKVVVGDGGDEDEKREGVDDVDDEGKQGNSAEASPPGAEATRGAQEVKEETTQTARSETGTAEGGRPGQEFTPAAHVEGEYHFSNPPPPPPPPPFSRL